MAKKKVRVRKKQLSPEERAAAEQRAEQAENEIDMAGARRARDRSRRMRALIEALKAERERQGLSLEAMGQRIGMDRKNLYRIESDPNANPTLETIDRLAEALGKDIGFSLTDRAA
jgi:DNA-binding XRE family transcriptional regulator